MKSFIKKYSRECRAAMLLVVVYSIHLLAYHVLLSTHNDFLSSTSFDNHQQNPKSTTDCLLLLAKKNLTKQTVSIDLDLALAPHTLCAVLNPPHKISLPTAHPQCLSSDSYERYRLFGVFLI